MKTSLSQPSSRRVETQANQQKVSACSPDRAFQSKKPLPKVWSLPLSSTNKSLKGRVSTAQFPLTDFPTPNEAKLLPAVPPHSHFEKKGSQSFKFRQPSVPSFFVPHKQRFSRRFAEDGRPFTQQLATSIQTPTKLEEIFLKSIKLHIPHDRLFKARTLTHYAPWNTFNPEINNFNPGDVPTLSSEQQQAYIDILNKKLTYSFPGNQKKFNFSIGHLLIYLRSVFGDSIFSIEIVGGFTRHLMSKDHSSIPDIDFRIWISQKSLYSIASYTEAVIQFLSALSEIPVEQIKSQGLKNLKIVQDGENNFSMCSISNLSRQHRNNKKFPDLDLIFIKNSNLQLGLKNSFIGTHDAFCCVDVLPLLPILDSIPTPPLIRPKIADWKFAKTLIEKKELKISNPEKLDHNAYLAILSLIVKGWTLHNDQTEENSIQILRRTMLNHPYPPVETRLEKYIASHHFSNDQKFFLYLQLCLDLNTIDPKRASSLWEKHPKPNTAWIHQLTQGLPFETASMNLSVALTLDSHTEWKKLNNDNVLKKNTNLPIFLETLPPLNSFSLSSFSLERLAKFLKKSYLRPIDSSVQLLELTNLQKEFLYLFKTTSHPPDKKILYSLLLRLAQYKELPSIIPFLLEHFPEYEGLSNQKLQKKLNQALKNQNIPPISWDTIDPTSWTLTLLKMDSPTHQALAKNYLNTLETPPHSLFLEVLNEDIPESIEDWWIAQFLNYQKEKKLSLSKEEWEKVFIRFNKTLTPKTTPLCQTALLKLFNIAKKEKEIEEVFNLSLSFLKKIPSKEITTEAARACIKLFPKDKFHAITYLSNLLKILSKKEYILKKEGLFVIIDPMKPSFGLSEEQQEVYLKVFSTFFSKEGRILYQIEKNEDSKQKIYRELILITLKELNEYKISSRYPEIWFSLLSELPIASINAEECKKETITELVKNSKEVAIQLEKRKEWLLIEMLSCDKSEWDLEEADENERSEIWKEYVVKELKNNNPLDDYVQLEKNKHLLKNHLQILLQQEIRIFKFLTKKDLIFLPLKNLFIFLKELENQTILFTEQQRSKKSTSLSELEKRNRAFFEFCEIETPKLIKEFIKRFKEYHDKNLNKNQPEKVRLILLGACIAQLTLVSERLSNHNQINEEYYKNVDTLIERISLKNINISFSILESFLVLAIGRFGFNQKLQLPISRKSIYRKKSSISKLIKKIQPSNFPNKEEMYKFKDLLSYFIHTGAIENEKPVENLINTLTFKLYQFLLQQGHPQTLGHFNNTITQQTASCEHSTASSLPEKERDSTPSNQLPSVDVKKPSSEQGDLRALL